MATIDHHPAVRRDLEAAVELRSGLLVVGSAADRDELWPLLRRSDAQVLVIGRPQRDHPTELCRQVRIHVPTCRVLLCASTALSVAAILAGAHGLVDRSADTATIVDAIWIVGTGGRLLSSPSPEMTRQASARLLPADRAIMAMLLAGTSVSDVASVTGLGRRDVEGRRAAIIATLAGRRRPASEGAPLAA